MFYTFRCEMFYIMIRHLDQFNLDLRYSYFTHFMKECGCMIWKSVNIIFIIIFFFWERSVNTIECKTIKALKRLKNKFYKWHSNKVLNYLLVFLTKTFRQGWSQNLELGVTMLLLVVCSDFDLWLCCYLVA